MNERPDAGKRKGGVNVCFWLVAVSVMCEALNPAG
jgi:hypothetical protein